jgi:HEPN domain-containing protein
MNGERLDYPSPYEDDYPTHWPETRQRIQNTEEWAQEFNRMVDENHWNQKILGFTAEQAVENSLKGWLSTYNDNRTYGHDLTELWEDVAKMEDWSNPELDRLYKSMSELFNHIKYEDPNRPGKQCDWLTNYSVIYRYAGTSHHMNQNERLELREKVNNAVASMIERIHDKSGTTDSDVYPEGIKPWEVTP